MSQELGIEQHQGTTSVAEGMRPLVDALVASDASVDIAFWDGSSITRGTPVGTLNLRSSRAIQHIMWAPRGLGLARAYVSGDIDVTGDTIAVVEQLRSSSPQERNLSRCAHWVCRAGARRSLTSSSGRRAWGCTPRGGMRPRSATTTTSPTTSTPWSWARP